jgi:hypothetical protein
MEFHDEKGQKLGDVIRDGTALLEENRTYRLVFQLEETARQGWRGWLGELELEWEPERASFVVRTGFWVGSQSLRVHGPDGEKHLPVEVLPRKTKLDSEAWAQLLRDLDTWFPGSTLGREGGRHGSVGNSGSDIVGVASTLGDLVPAFVSALSALMRAPQERSAEHRVEVPVHAVRQADRATLRWLVRHPDVYQGISGHTEEHRSGSEPMVPTRGSRGDLDHAANRSIVWLTRQAVRKLRETAECVRKSLGKKRNQSLDPDLKHWCEGRVKWLLEGAESLESLLRRKPWSSLAAEPASQSAELTLMGNPVYARVHAIAQIFRSPRFQLPQDDALIDAPVRPSYEVYELWTFLALRRLLEPLVPGAVWTEQDVDKLRCFDQEPNGARYSAHQAGHGTLELHFNLPFPGFLTKKRESHHLWSISGARRPDLVVAWRPEQGPGRWICLDAKYRTDKQNVADAFESVHIYRDALRWKEMGERGRCSGAVLLIPALHEELVPWSEKAFRDEHHVGIFRLTPGQTAPADLVDWLREKLLLPGS